MNRTIFLQLRKHQYHRHIDEQGGQAGQRAVLTHPDARCYYEYLRDGWGKPVEYSEVRDFIAEQMRTNHVPRAETAVLAAQLCHQDGKAFGLALAVLEVLLPDKSALFTVVNCFSQCVQALCRRRYRENDSVLGTLYRVYRGLYQSMQRVEQAPIDAQIGYVDAMGLFNHYIIEYQRVNLSLEPQAELIALVFRLLLCRYKEHDCGSLLECISVLLQDTATLERVTGPRTDTSAPSYVETLAVVQKRHIYDDKFIQLVTQMLQTAGGGERGFRSVKPLFDHGIIAAYLGIVGEKGVAPQVTGLLVNASYYSRALFDSADKLLPVVQLLRSSNNAVVNNCLQIIDLVYRDQGAGNLASIVPLLVKNLLKILSSRRLDAQLLQNALCLIEEMQRELDDELTERGFLDVLYRLQGDCTREEMDVLRLFLENYQ